MSHERRRLFFEEEPLAEPGRYGCPMLFRTRFYPSSRAAGPAMRCALGWALHNEVEVARCRATDAVTDCWKVHPERTPVIVLPGTEAEADADGDPGLAPTPATAKVAGD